MDLQSVLLDEIALEGLDGITIPTLFTRLKNSKYVGLNFNEELVQEYVWKSILAISKRSPSDLQLYKLPSQRPCFVLYNKYENNNSFVFYEEPDSVPKDIYLPLAPVEGELERGSCIHYKTRVNVTEKIIEKPTSLKDTLEQYNESLVIVASQYLRNRSLGINGVDPAMTISDKIYAFLERVGRMRYLGLSTVGSEGSFEILEKEKSTKNTITKSVKAKDAFYFRRSTTSKKLAKVHPFCVNVNNTTVTGHVVFLCRFYNRTVTPLESIAIQTSAYLELQPDQESDMLSLIKHFEEHSKKAFSHLFGTYSKNFSTFYREFPKPATGKSKSFAQVVKRKFVKLLKPFCIEDEEEDQDYQENVDENENDDIAEESSALSETFYRPDVILADRTILSQVLALIETSDDGLSLVEIGKQLSVSRLDSRSFVRVLMLTNCIKSIKVDNGRQKVTKFLPIVKFEKSREEFSVAHNGLDFNPGEDTILSVKRSNCILEIVDREMVVAGTVSLRKRIIEMEKDRGFSIDRKSIKTLVSKLASMKKLRTENVVTVTPNGQKCEQLFIISNQVEENSPLITERINQWKFQLVSSACQSPSKPIKRGLLLSRDENAGNIGSEMLIHQPSIGKKYGTEPKLVRALTLYRYLHHLLYVLPENDAHEFDDWRKHIKPLPDIQNNPTCMLGDAAPRIPLSVFVRIVYLTHIVPGLEDFLGDPEKSVLPVSDLPMNIQRGLTYRRKYLYSLYEGLKILEHMNLAEIEHKITDPKESAKVTLKKEFEFKDRGIFSKYMLDTDEDIELFQEDLRAHCTNSCSDCSLPPVLFAHNMRNWTESSKPRIVSSFDLYSRKMLSLTNEIFLVKKEQTQSKKITRKDRKVDKLETIANCDVVMEDDTPDFETKKRKRKLPSESTTPQKKRVRHDDEIDINALKLLKTHRNRSNWTKEEDSFLIIARTASLLLDPTCNTSLCVASRVVRDELHTKFDHSRDKTAKAVQRRIVSLTYKDLVLKARLNEWLIELKQEDDFYGIQRPTVPKTDENVWNEAYLNVFNKLKEKYDEPFTTNFSSSSQTTVEHVIDMDDYVINETANDSVLSPPVFTEPQDFVNVYMNVVLNVLLSTLLMNDDVPDASQKFAKTLYNIYRRYPDALIRACVARLSKGNIMSKFREKNTNVNRKTVSRMVAYKLSSHYNFLLDTKFRFSSLIDPNVPELEQVTSEGAPEALALTSLAASRTIKYQITIPDEILSLDEEAMKKLGVEQSGTIQRDSKDSSRTLLASFRSQMVQKSEFSERFSGDSFTLNKCKVVAEMGEKRDISVQFEGAWKYFTREFECDNSKIPFNETLKFVESKQVIGASLEQIQAFKIGATEQDLKEFEDKNFIYRVGVNTFKWVHRDHIAPWIATDLNPNNSNVESSIKYIAKIWRKPDGSINTKTVFKFMTAVFAHVLLHPGVSEKNLVEYFQQLAPGTQVREIIELLMAADCLQIISNLPPIEDHSRASSPDINVTDRWFETTSDSVLILSLLKKRLDKEYMNI